MVSVGEQGQQTGMPDASLLRRRLIGPVLVLVMDNAPVNALTVGLRRALWQALSHAEVDPAVEVVLLTGNDRLFSAGADIAEFARASEDPALPDLCLRIGRFAKPVIAALRGHVLGGGLELALAAHYRIADVNARLGFPEVGLGLLPGAGGTQRAPCLIGAEQALRMMLTGTPVTAIEALAMGLVDHVHDRRVMPAALQFARKRPPPRPTLEVRSGLRDVAGFQEAVRKARKAQAGVAAARIIDCVEAGLLLPEAQALAYERAAFEDLLASPESLALRHLFRAERLAGKLPAAVAVLDLPQPASIGVWGAGEAVADLVARAMSAGVRVTLADPDRDALVACLRRIADGAERQVAAGRMTPEARDADWARLTTVMTPEGLQEVDLIVVRPGAPVLPPQSGVELLAFGGLPIGDAGGVALSCGPGGVVELASGPDAGAEQVARAAALARRLGGRLVLVGPGGSVAGCLADKLRESLGFLRSQGMDADGALRALAGGDVTATAAAGLRICLSALANAGAGLLAAGTVRCPADVDVVAVACGVMPRAMGGPMHRADRRGVLLLRADLARLVERAPGLFTPHPLFSELISQGKTLDSLNR